MVGYLANAFLVLAAGSAPAERHQPVPVAEVAQDYAGPKQLVRLKDGRRINLHCRGTGPTTVIFDSGGSDWSSIWALVQPAVARTTTACSYDRAGLGYSDPAERPATPTAIVEDLHELLRAAGIKRPVVLVGHSLGGFNMKLYAATYPADVAGLVLVDPSEERAGARMGAAERKRFGKALEAQTRREEREGFASIVEHYAKCAEAARSQDLDPESAMYKRCTDPVRAPLGPVIAAAREKVQVRYAYQAAQASELKHSVYGPVPQPNRRYASVFRPGAFGAKPLIVLTHGFFDMSYPTAELAFFEIVALHKQTAALSTRGVQRIVPRTHHNIEIDDPKSIIAAVDEVVTAVERKRGGPLKD
jgi:pimeloyl-ACP methyl ester carboxylesterase